MSAVSLFNTPGSSIPPLPDKIRELMSMEPSQPARRCARLLKSEPTMLSHVLQLAESPYYSGRRPMQDATQLTERIGLPGFQGLVMRAVMEEIVFVGDHPLLEIVQQHATATAYISTILARYTPIPAEEVFLAALIQNVGLAIPLNTAIAAMTPEDELWQALLYAHEGIAGLTAEAWNLPDTVGNIVRKHHQLDRNIPENRSIAALVVADYIADEMGMGIQHPAHPAVGESIMSLALDILDLTPEQLPTLQYEASDLLFLLQ